MYKIIFFNFCILYSLVVIKKFLKIKIYSKNNFFQSSRIITHQVLSTSNFQFANFTILLANSTKGSTTMNISVEIHQDLLQIPVYVRFGIPADKNDKEYSKTILKVTINYCRMVEGVAADFVSRMLLDDLRNVSNIPFKCPFPKGLYKFTDYVLNDKFFPSYLLSQDINYLTTAKIMAKVAGQKSLVMLFNTKTYGTISKN